MKRVDSRMSNNGGEDVLAPLRKAIQEQDELVHRLKLENRSTVEVERALTELKARKKQLESKEEELSGKKKFDRSGLEDLVKRRFFFGPAFYIYGGVAGLYDLGPMGCAMKANLLSQWRSHFVLEEHMLEVDTTILTPEPILKTSGHVDRFADFMVKDSKTGDCYRADHLLAEHLEKLSNDPKCSKDKKAEYDLIMKQVDNYKEKELTELFRKYEVKAPVTGNPVTDPVYFNLMFATSIGPGGQIAGFLRPETAQGIFVNFKRLLEFNNGKLPFAAAQIGKSFRNEISPRSGLLRVREFEMAEIEHFVNPDKRNDFPKFSTVADVKGNFLSACNQVDGKSAEEMTFGEALRLRLIANATLAYYMARIHLYMVKVGVDPSKLRFRQHMSNEMAHYASDCWDAECKTSYGWVECVGCADRSCYDLTCHSRATKVDLSAKEDLPTPRQMDVVEVVPDKGLIGKQFRKDAKAITEYLTGLSGDAVKQVEQELAEKGSYTLQVEGNTFTLQPNMLTIKRYEKTIHVVDVIPSVIEPSFGIGRILYTILEHSYRVREEDEQRKWLALPSLVAPISCSVLPLSGNEEFIPYIAKIAENLKDAGITHKVDDSSGSIGRRYARTDEIGIPFGVTIDFDTIKTESVTLRERNSTRQVRIKISELAEVVRGMVRGCTVWADVEAKYPAFSGQESTTGQE